jgi:hypothetical protein
MRYTMFIRLQFVVCCFRGETCKQENVRKSYQEDLCKYFIVFAAFNNVVFVWHRCQYFSLRHILWMSSKAVLNIQPLFSHLISILRIFSAEEIRNVLLSQECLVGNLDKQADYTDLFI